MAVASELFGEAAATFEGARTLGRFSVKISSLLDIPGLSICHVDAT